MSADVCPWCTGDSRRSDWGPYCSNGCEYSAALAQARADGEAAGRAAERAQIAAWLREHSDGAPSGLWDAYALTLMASRIRAGDVVPDIGAGEHVGALGTTR